MSRYAAPHYSPKSIGRLLCLVSLIIGCTTWSAAQSQTVLHSFNDAPLGANPDSRLVADALGNFYGTTSSGGTFGGGTAYRLSPQGDGYRLTTIYNFGAEDGGFQPSGLVFDSLGNLYGTLNTGTGGSVFELIPGAKGIWNAQIISVFETASGPSGTLTFDHAGNIYGVSASGGANNFGAVYELSPAAQGEWLLTTLYSFRGTEDGANPNSGLTFDASGVLYGTTLYGGSPDQCGPHNTSGCGTIFALTNNGPGTWTESVLLIFNIDNGGAPQGGLVFDSAGNFYGAAQQSSGYCLCGTIYRMSPNSDGTWTQTLLYNFAGGPDGGFPNGFLAMDSHGNLYGTSTEGGSSNCSFCGSVFEISPSPGPYWKERTLRHFSIDSPPQTGLIFDSAANLYGVTPYTFDYGSCFSESSDCLGTIYKLTPTGQGSWKSVNLFSFPTGNDGVFPVTSLIEDSNGNLYGVTAGGGDYSCNTPGCGAVFELSPLADGGWSENVIYSVTNPYGALAAGSALVLDAAGNLYGTFPETGDGTCNCGLVYELSRDASGNWQQTVIHNFVGGKDGAYPEGALALGPDGHFYGTTSSGGTSNNLGTVYELIRGSNGTWTEKVIYTFHGTDGSNPAAALVFDPQGNIYGTTNDGGIGTAACFYGGCGVVFELSKSATGTFTETVLYAFQGLTDGDTPSGLARDSAGNLYGTTATGGITSSYCRSPGGGHLPGCGTVFEVSNSGGQWRKTILYSFQPATASEDGAAPVASLVFDNAGDLYGTTSAGGDANCRGYVYDIPGCGTVFELSPGSGGLWSESTVYVFNGADGAEPTAAVFLDSLGNIFGTTYQGGDANIGEVFEISPGSNAPAKPRMMRHISGLTLSPPSEGSMIERAILRK